MSSTLQSFAMNNHRRVLLSVAGTTPQIITETVYALVRRKYPFIPDEIRVITTKQGQLALNKGLFEEGHFARLVEALGLPAGSIEFSPAHIDVVLGPDEQPLHDLISAEDHTAAADQIIRTVAKLAADDTTAIHASLAGGRKTMGFYLGKAMSLFGRPADRLSHVLVNEPFEETPGFYFPPLEPVDLPLRRGGTANTANARISLAEIPFLHLGRSLHANVLRAINVDDFSFSDAVLWAQRATEQPTVVVNIETRSVWLGEEKSVELQLSPLHKAFYVWMLWRRANEQTVFNITGTDWSPLYDLQLKMGMTDGLDVNALDGDLKKGNFDNWNHKINAALKQAMGPFAGPLYGLSPRKKGTAGTQALKTPPRSGDYLLAGLHPEDIHFVPPTLGDDQ